jgi:hypothetical protein
MFVREFIQALSGNDMHKMGRILSEAVSDEKHSAFRSSVVDGPWSPLRQGYAARRQKSEIRGRKVISEK